MKIVCNACGYIGDAKEMTKGSRRKEMMLWCCLVLPGLLYTLWRQSSDGRYQGCARCRSTDFRPLKRKEWKQYERSGHLAF